jgi:hypothetical protein
MRVFEEKQGFNQWWIQIINLGLLGLLFYFIYKWYVVGEKVDKVPANDYWGQVLVIALLLLSMGLIYIFRLTTIVDDRGISYQFFPFHRNLKLKPWSTMDKCYTRKYNPLSEYGGWGYKLGTNGKAFNVKGNQGIQIKFKNGKKLLLGTQKPEEAQMVIDRYFKKYNERGQHSKGD